MNEHRKGSTMYRPHVNNITQSLGGSFFFCKYIFSFLFFAFKANVRPRGMKSRKRSSTDRAAEVDAFFVPPQTTPRSHLLRGRLYKTTRFPAGDRLSYIYILYPQISILGGDRTGNKRVLTTYSMIRSRERIPWSERDFFLPFARSGSNVVGLIIIIFRFSLPPHLIDPYKLNRTN